MSQWAQLGAAAGGGDGGAGPSALGAATPEQEFLAAAGKLQARLCLGVKAELDATKAAVLHLYRRRVRAARLQQCAVLGSSLTPVRLQRVQATPAGVASAPNTLL